MEAWLAVRCGQCPPYKNSIARDYLWECYRIRYSLSRSLNLYCSFDSNLRY